MDYPYIKYPPDVKRILESDDFDVELDKKIYPPKKKQLSFIGVKVSTAIILLVAIFYYLNFIGLILAVPLAILGLLFLFGSIKEIISIFLKNRKEENNFREEQVKRRARKQEYIRRKKIIKDNGKEHLLKKLQITKFLSNYKPPQPTTKSFPTLEESFFFFFLHNFFGQWIKVDLALSDTPYDLENYSPSFILSNSKICLAINVLSKSNLPTDENSRTIVGDNHAIIHNWVVIYFTPNQILNQPIKCCYFIAKEIYQLTGGKSIFERFKEINHSQDVSLQKRDNLNSSNFYKELMKYDFLSVQEGDIIVTRENWREAPKLTLRNFSPLPPQEIYCAVEVFPGLKPFGSTKINLKDYILGKPTYFYMGPTSDFDSNIDYSSKEYCREIPSIINLKN